VIERMIRRQSNREVHLEWSAKGLACELVVKMYGSELVKTQHPAHCGGGILGETFQVVILASWSGRPRKTRRKV
jgi:hypothetical protein